MQTDKQFNRGMAIQWEQMEKSLSQKMLPRESLGLEHEEREVFQHNLGPPPSAH